MASRAAISLVLLACFSGQASASQAFRHQRNEVEAVESHPSGYVKAQKFKHRLRVCNAYPNVASLEVYRGKTEKLTADGGPMAYKQCREFRQPLLAGDMISFRGPVVADPLMAGVSTGGAYAGTFSVSDLPNNDAVLLLVIHRHDTLTTAASFESHVFANLLNAQVAIIDTYKGRMQAKPIIVDAASVGKKDSRNENLKFNSVVAVNPGVYEVDLNNMDGSTAVKGELVALNRESYVVLRVGAESQDGVSMPEDVVVFPKSDSKELYPPKRSGAAGFAAPVLLIAALLGLVGA